MKLWMDGKIIEEGAWGVSPLSHALHYGTGVFEGIRAHETNDGAVVFRLMDHIARLESSASAIGLTIPYSNDALRQAVIDTLQANGLTDAYIRPLVFVGAGSLALTPAPAQMTVHTLIAAWQWDDYFTKARTHGITVATDVGRRVTTNVGLLQAKIAGTYVSGYAATVGARALGADEAILFDDSGYIAEASVSNVFLLRNGSLYTPTTRVALAGITRDSVIKLAHRLGYVSQISNLTRDDLYSAEEVFLTGTASGIVPVIEVDGKAVGTGAPGPLTLTLMEAYRNATHASDSFSSNIWLEALYADLLPTLETC